MQLLQQVYVCYILRYFKDLLPGSGLMALWLKPSWVGVSQAMATLIWCAPHCTKFGRHCQAPPFRLHFNRTLFKENSTTPCTPLNYWLSVWVVCLQFSAHIDIPGILLMCFCVTHFLFCVSSQVVPPDRFLPCPWYILYAHWMSTLSDKIAYMLQAWVKYLL